MQEVSLVTATAYSIQAGKYTFQAIVPSGTMTLAMSIDNGANFKQIKNASWTDDDNDVLNLGDCQLKPTFSAGTFTLKPSELVSDSASAQAITAV